MCAQAYDFESVRMLFVHNITTPFMRPIQYIIRALLILELFMRTIIPGSWSFFAPNLIILRAYIK